RLLRIRLDEDDALLAVFKDGSGRNLNNAGRRRTVDRHGNELTAPQPPIGILDVSFHDRRVLIGVQQVADVGEHALLRRTASPSAAERPPLRQSTASDPAPSLEVRVNRPHAHWRSPASAPPSPGRTGWWCCP